MVSTTKYKKYLAKQDPSLLEEMERRGRDLGKYKSRITSLSRDLISYIGNDEEDRVAPADSTTELVEIMDRFVNVALAHVKTLDETKMDESGRDLEENQHTDEYDGESVKSAWGPTLHRYGYTPKKQT
jgi:hypothetical protein